MTVDKVTKCHENCRSFVSAFMDLAEVDVLATVQETIFSGQRPNEDEERYTIDGKLSPRPLIGTMYCSILPLNGNLTLLQFSANSFSSK